MSRYVIDPPPGRRPPPARNRAPRQRLSPRDRGEGIASLHDINPDDIASLGWDDDCAPWCASGEMGMFPDPGAPYTDYGFDDEYGAYPDEGLFDAPPWAGHPLGRGAHVHSVGRPWPVRPSPWGRRGSRPRQRPGGIQEQELSQRLDEVLALVRRVRMALAHQMRRTAKVRAAAARLQEKFDARGAGPDMFGAEPPDECAVSPEREAYAARTRRRADASIDLLGEQLTDALKLWVRQPPRPPDPAKLQAALGGLEMLHRLLRQLSAVQAAGETDPADIAARMAQMAADALQDPPQDTPPPTPANRPPRPLWRYHGEWFFPEGPEEVVGMFVVPTTLQAEASCIHLVGVRFGEAAADIDDFAPDPGLLLPRAYAVPDHGGTVNLRDTPLELVVAQGLSHPDAEPVPWLTVHVGLVCATSRVVWRPAARLGAPPSRSDAPPP